MSVERLIASMTPASVKHLLRCILWSMLCLALCGCPRPDPKAEAERTAAIEKVTRFFESIPKGPPNEGKIKCYRNGLTSEIILELTSPAVGDRRPITREGVISMLGTYFIVQEIRDLTKHQVSLTCFELDSGGKELGRVTVRFEEILPFFNGHDF